MKTPGLASEEEIYIWQLLRPLLGEEGLILFPIRIFSVTVSPNDDWSFVDVYQDVLPIQNLQSRTATV